MMNRDTFPKLVSVGILAVGMTIVWAVTTGWSSNLIRDLLVSKDKTIEYLSVATDGSPLITTYINGVNGHHTIRKLDGTAIEKDEHDSSFQNALYRCPLHAGPPRPGLVPYPLPWTHRLGNTSDIDNPPVYWHFVRDKQEQGHAYFVGYESISKRVAGYIGRQGFRTSLPPQDEWFNVGYNHLGHSLHIYASFRGMGGASSYNRWRNKYASTSRRPPDWVGFLIDRDQIWEIDLRQRTVNLFAEAKGATSLGFANEPLAPDANDVEITAPEEDPEVSDDKFRPKTAGRFVVKYPDRIIAWDLEKRTSETFLLPESLHNASFDIFMLGNGQLLAHYGEGHWENGPQYRLRWLDSAGNEFRNELVKLVGHVPLTERAEAWREAWAAPLPAYWLYRTFARRPFELLQHRQSPTYGVALARTWQTSWPTVVVLILLAAIATLVAWNWHKRFARPNAIYWTAFVLLFSVPGLIAYRLFHGSPALEPCPECNKKVPRNRDACAGCQQPFAEPSLLGTEVFV